MTDELKPLSETLKFKIGQIVQVNVGGNDPTWRLAYYQGWNYRGHYYSYTLNSAHYLTQDVREVNEIAALKRQRDMLLEVLKQYADRQNWGYYDGSGCDKGHGEYTDACFIGPEVAQAVIAAVEGERG